MTFLPDYNSPTSLKSFLEAEGLSMQKRYGQNFLINPPARERLLEALNPEEGSIVWELGPGLGAMTAALLERKVRLCAFEIDRGFVVLLSKFFKDYKNFTLIEGDALKTLPHQATIETPDYFIGNLPYNIAATALGTTIERGIFFKRQVITVQKEVADRICAKEGSRDYASISLLVASAYKSEIIATLKPANFWPEPRVQSASLLLKLKDKSEREKIPAIFSTLSRALFSGRRKMISNTVFAFLNGRLGKKEGARESVSAIFKEVGLSGNERIETLSLSTFTHLAQAVEKVLKEEKSCE